MKRLTAIAVTAFAAALSTAQAETLPLPQSIISLSTPEGAALLIEAEASTDYFPLSIHFTTQDNPAYCGPASIAMVLNALEIPRPASDMTLGLGMFDQENIFTPAAEAVKPAEAIVNPPYGMTLDEVGGVLAAHDLAVEVVHASESDLDTFRQTAITQLADDEHFILVNYLRSAIEQETGGHISPLGAYDADTDRFLILDVSRYKYPPIWVEAAALFDAMNTVDSDNYDKTRGYVSVRR
ncbi:phytochelatin synthase family protein [Tropicimonas sediminicola]|uniref:glutathione gamma-glutamylcysteinyltransferase n=1 Tax=Tropicimonas sediminicola TaxID=1031541 RepID=A0A239IZV7_9RHOB|nr:phytochelatin synthase family protein [Tropicimonas sediminicola]SNS98553.1 Phytochelatin synthase [Tropicimonas sediminicola]